MTEETETVRCDDCAHFESESPGCGGYCSAPVPDYVNDPGGNYVNCNRKMVCPAFEAIPCPYTEKPKGPPNRIMSSKDYDPIQAEVNRAERKSIRFGLAVCFSVGLVGFVAVILIEKYIW